MQRFKDFFRPKETNANGTVSYFLTYGNNIVLSNYDDPKLALDGYAKNIVAYSCISRIAEHASKMEYKLWRTDSRGKKDSVIDKHPILDLLYRPYKTLTKDSFLNRVSSQYLIYGNYYIEKWYSPRNGVYKKSIPIFLYPLRPDLVTIKEAQDGLNESYTYSNDKGFNVRFETDKRTGKSNIIHGMTFNPQSDNHGMSPMAPAGYSIDLHNELRKQDLGFMSNGARPSGILTVPAGVNLGIDQIDRLKFELKEKYEGSANRGKPLVLNNGMTWQQISVNSTDGEFQEIKKSAALEIGLAYRVPMEILNQTASKFDNLMEAYEQFYSDAVIPLSKNIVSELNSDLLPLYPDSENLILEADFSNTRVIQQSRIRLMEKINPINFITNNEKRMMTDFELLDGEDELKNPVPITKDQNKYIAEQINNGLSYDEALAQMKVIYG